MTTIQLLGGATLTPLLVIGYDTARPVRNVVHPIIGQANPDVTIRTAGLRTGTLEMLTASLAAGIALEALHLPGTTLRLVDTNVPAAGMYYVPTGDLRLTLDPETLIRAIVRVGFQEVTV